MAVRLWKRTEQNARAVEGAAQFVGRTRLETLADPAGGVTTGTNIIHFEDGAYTKLHSHPSGQILVILDGNGFVETEEKRLEVKEGNVVIRPPGERHRH